MCQEIRNVDKLNYPGQAHADSEQIKEKGGRSRFCYGGGTQS